MDRTTGACVDMERFNRLDWPIQKERILAFCRKWRGLLVMDATGIGDPIYDDLARVWPRIEAVKFTNQKDPVGPAARGCGGATDGVMAQGVGRADRRDEAVRVRHRGERGDHVQRAERVS
jgi:hypothetical protein